MNSNDIKSVVEQYKKSVIQSESEVGSKLVVPLLQQLGFPDQNRAQEFPIYAHQAKGVLRADYLLFSSPDFARNRANKKDQLDWVAKHSLLVVETKIPGKLPEVDEQPVEYALRTKAVAYIFTDGDFIRGYYIQPYREDSLVFECKVIDLWKCENLSEFTYDSLVHRKEKLRVSYSPTGLLVRGIDADNSVEIVNNDELITLSDDYINRLKRALGKEDEELSKAKVLEMFLTRTDNILQNDYRYDIPKYMMGIPRGVVQGEVYTANAPLFVLRGEVTIYYRDNEDYLDFDADYVQICIHLRDGVVDKIAVQPKVFGNVVSERVNQYEIVLKLFESPRITLEYLYKDKKHRVVAEDVLKTINPREKEESVFLVKSALQYMRDLALLEDYYSVNFDLSVFDQDNRDVYHGDLEKVFYLKTAMLDEDNYLFGIPSKPFKGQREIQGAELLASEFPVESLPPNINLYGQLFVPERVIVSDKRIAFRERIKGVVDISVCWKYKVANHAE